VSNSKQLPKILHQSATHHLASALSPHTAASRSLCCQELKSPSSAIQKSKELLCRLYPFRYKVLRKTLGLKRDSWTPDCRKLRKVNFPRCPLTTQQLCSVFENHKFLNDPISASLSQYTRARQMETLKLAKNRDPIYQQHYKHVLRMLHLAKRDSWRHQSA